MPRARVEGDGGRVGVTEGGDTSELSAGLF